MIAAAILTLSRDLDLGLVLDGDTRRRKGSRSIEGIDALGADLVGRAALAGFDPDAIARELRSVRWIAPDGFHVTKVELWSPGMSPAAPFVAGERRELVVISPFLSDAFVATLAETTTQSADRTLVTTLPAVRALGPESKPPWGNSGFSRCRLPIQRVRERGETDARAGRGHRRKRG